MNGGGARESAARVVSAVDADPMRRLALAEGFYPPALRRYGRAELTFLRWELDRGVLDPKTGSPWWRAVNSRLLLDKQEAMLLDGATGAESTVGARRWREFLNAPSISSWYRAHNHSVVAGYLDNTALAAAESAAERFMMNVTLARALFTHALVERPELALGRFARLGPRIGDPRTGSVGWFLDLRNVFPAQYPMPDMTIEQLLAGEGRRARLIDFGLVVPKLDAVYGFAAERLEEPRIIALIDDRSFCYTGRQIPLTADRVSRLVAALTAPRPVGVRGT